jgi:hypothetical protein
MRSHFVLTLQGHTMLIMDWLDPSIGNALPFTINDIYLLTSYRFLIEFYTSFWQDLHIVVGHFVLTSPFLFVSARNMHVSDEHEFV